MYRGLPVLLLLPPPLEVVLAGGPTFAAAVSGAPDVDVVDVVLDGGPPSVCLVAASLPLLILVSDAGALAGFLGGGGSAAGAAALSAPAFLLTQRFSSLS